MDYTAAMEYRYKKHGRYVPEGINKLWSDLIKIG